MSEHFSHLFRGRISEVREASIDDAVAHLDAQVVTYNDPGDGPRGWIASPNMGFPFDRDRERAITAALETAGLWPIVSEGP